MDPIVDGFQSIGVGALAIALVLLVVYVSFKGLSMMAKGTIASLIGLIGAAIFLGMFATDTDGSFLKRISESIKSEFEEQQGGN